MSSGMEGEESRGVKEKAESEEQSKSKQRDQRLNLNLSILYCILNFFSFCMFFYYGLSLTQQSSLKCGHVE